MESFTLESSFVAALGNLLLGLAVFLRRPSSRTHQAFALLSASMVLWNGADFAFELARSASPPRPTFVYHRLVFLGSMAIPLAAFLLARALTGRGRDWTWTYAWVLLVEFGALVALLFSPLFPKGYQLVAAIYQFSNLALALVLLLLRFHEAGPVERSQLKYLILGGLVASTLGVTDYLAAGWPGFPPLGAPAVLLYLCLVAAAVGRHGLFSASRLFGRWVAILVVTLLLVAVSEGVERLAPPGHLADVLTPLLLATLVVALYDPLRDWLRLYRGRSRTA
jgi:N-terminal 7TM region of histidine kinase